MLNGEGRTAHGASISRHACVSVRAGCFPPFKAVVMFRCPLQCGSTKENTGLQRQKKQGNGLSVTGIFSELIMKSTKICKPVALRHI